MKAALLIIKTTAVLSLSIIVSLGVILLVGYLTAQLPDYIATIISK